MKLIVRVIFVLVASIAIITIIKSDSSHANPPPQATIPGCEPYHSISNANVRSCADLSCSVVRSVSSSETLCIRGEADNTDWYQIDLAPEMPVLLSTIFIIVWLSPVLRMQMQRYVRVGLYEEVWLLAFINAPATHALL